MGAASIIFRCNTNKCVCAWLLYIKLVRPPNMGAKLWKFRWSHTNTCVRKLMYMRNFGVANKCEQILNCQIFDKCQTTLMHYNSIPSRPLNSGAETFQLRSPHVNICVRKLMYFRNFGVSSKCAQSLHAEIFDKREIAFMLEHTIHPHLQNTGCKS